MCGACAHVAPDARVAGPRRRAAAAVAVAELTGLTVRPAIGLWTVASRTGRQEVCASVEDLAATAARFSGVPAADVARAATRAAADL